MGGGTGMPMAPIGMGISPSRGGDGTNSGDGWTGSRTGGAGGFSTVAMVCEARGGLSGGLVACLWCSYRGPRGGAMRGGCIISYMRQGRLVWVFFPGP